MYEVVGFKEVEYTRKRDGQQVHGTEVHLMSLDTPNQNGFEGREVIKAWLGQNAVYSPSLGDTVRIYYNRFGGVDDLVSC